MRAQMTCAQCHELIPGLHAQQLPEGDRAAVARHLAGCAACCRELAFWSAVGEVLAESDAGQPITVDQARVWRGVQVALAHERREATIQLQERGHRMTTQTPSPRSSRSTSMPPMLRHRRSTGAAVAVVLLIALSVALFGVVAPHLRPGGARTGMGSQATATPAACAASQIRQSLPANAELSAISMVSARDGWAVGQIWDPRHTATPPQTLMMHFQNCRWQQASQSVASATLTEVAMASPTEGWAVGSTLQPYTNGSSTEWVSAHGLFLHYHGGVWQSVAFPGSQEAISEQIRMVSPTDGWMLVNEGKVHTTPNTVAFNETLYHYDGMRWSVQPMPFKTPSLDLADLAAGPNELWIVGYNPEGYLCCGMIAHYQAGRWSTWSNVISNSGLDTFSTVALSSPQNVWVFGTHRNHNSQSAGDFTAVALRYDGAKWSQVTVAGVPSVPSTVKALPSGDVWGLAPSSHNPPVLNGITVIHCAATGCLATSVTVPGVDGVRALTIVSATQGFAIGDHWVHGQGINVQESTLLSFDGSQWSVIPSAG